MALKAGRVGVRSDQVDPYGRINTGSELEPATAETLGGVKVGSGLSITEEGVLSAAATGTKLYAKEYTIPNNTLHKTEITSGWYEMHTDDVSIANYTPLFVVAIDVYTGYLATPGGIRSNGSSKEACAFIHSDNGKALKLIVYYIKNSDIDTLE